MSRSKQDEIRWLPAGSLALSEHNVRKTNSEEGIEELAALIKAEGVLQNLVVCEEPSAADGAPRFGVIAGGRRLRAIQLLIEQGHLTAQTPIACLVTSLKRATAISATENSGRREMHPADQFEAFRKLIDDRQSIEDVAARFGVSALTVQRRLKLANVCPEFIALYRHGKLTLEHLMAFAVTEDHAKQQQVWKGLKAYERDPGSLRRALTAGEVSARDPLARFVGVKAYENAGGILRRDLFAQAEEGGLLDAELLRRLATEKLDKHAAKVKDEGFAWVTATPSLDYSDLAAYGRVQTLRRDPTSEEQAKLDAIAARRSEIEAQAAAAEDDEERLIALDEQAETLDAEEAEIDEAREVPDPQQQALAGAVVTIGHDGKVRIERNLLKPEDKARFARAKRARGAASAGDGKPHSAALNRRLSAHRTLAMQAVLCDLPDIALAAVTHRLALGMFYGPAADRDNPLQIDARQPSLTDYGEDLKSSRAFAALQARRDALRAQMPPEADALFAWLLQQTGRMC